MADEIVLNNYSDDSKIKEYIAGVMMPRVFHNIPLNTLNVGHYSIISEYMSQGMENLAFTSSFYFNENFITKAVLPDSIYAEAALFNLGYSFAIPSTSKFILELKIADIMAASTLNPNTGLYEFILDKDTIINLSNGNSYSLDYDILVQYAYVDNGKGDKGTPVWNVQYTNKSEENCIAINTKTDSIVYRITDVWLCMYIDAREYSRTSITVVNNLTNGIPNEDAYIHSDEHICGFDIIYNSSKGSQYLKRDHILALHDSVKDNEPYIHYIMQDANTVKFMFSLNGTRRFVPEINSSFTVILYTCHGEAANFVTFDNEIEQPKVVTSTTKYPNNANVTKAAFVISSSSGGTNIGTVEALRRDTIEAYNTSNVLVTDHDIDEWFKTFYFKNILYPFFFKRRDDPCCKVWSGYIALKDDDNYIFRTNTLYAQIPYDVLYKNDNPSSSNEIIIPPGWVWTYIDDGKRYNVKPYTDANNNIITVAALTKRPDEYHVFANPFGIRITKDPHNIAYFNPWINAIAMTTHSNRVTDVVIESGNPDLSMLYHASPLITLIKRTYKNNYYRVLSMISPTSNDWTKGEQLISELTLDAIPVVFTEATWNYFHKPINMYAHDIQMVPLIDRPYETLPFNPEQTYLCARNVNRMDEETFQISDFWIETEDTQGNKHQTFIPISGEVDGVYGSNEYWGENGLWRGHEVYTSGDTTIYCYPQIVKESNMTFTRIQNKTYYQLAIGDIINPNLGKPVSMVVKFATSTTLTKYGQTNLNKIGRSYATATTVNIYYEGNLTQPTEYTFTNMANLYTTFPFVSENGAFIFDLSEAYEGDVLIYADMRHNPDVESIDYYRIPFSEMPIGKSIISIQNSVLDLSKNHMRVILHSYVNGYENGYCEMKPTLREKDGTYDFEVEMVPLNEMVNQDNRIEIASIRTGGGDWIPTGEGPVCLDATNPQLKMSILIESTDENRDSEILMDSTYTGYRVVDEYDIGEFSLIQELKEMRSNVNYSDSRITPTENQKQLYKSMMKVNEYGDLGIITEYCRARSKNLPTDMEFGMIKSIAVDVLEELNTNKTNYENWVPVEYQNPEALTEYTTITTKLNYMVEWTHDLGISETGNEYNFKGAYDEFVKYVMVVNDLFVNVNMNSGVEIQQVPFVEYSLMTSDRFESFVYGFTQVHRAIEPVINHRLEGNNYLDCKLLATYGLPHSYAADVDAEDENVFWPDLDVQVEFDVKLKNNNLAINTIAELKSEIMMYFARLTTIHRATDIISIDSNIYISNVVELMMKNHSNVAYLKFKGWYTEDKSSSKYMDANIQAIVQKKKSFEEMTKPEIESFVPEMFILEADNIKINII